MKKFVLIIALFAILFAVSAQAQTEVSKLPAEVQTALHKAIKAEQADPLLDLVFLWDLKFDMSIQDYIQTLESPIFVDLVDGYVQFDLDGGITVGHGYCQDIVKCGDLPYFDGDTQRDENPDKYRCAQVLKTFLRGHRQSEFWKALKGAIQTDQ